MAPMPCNDVPPLASPVDFLICDVVAGMNGNTLKASGASCALDRHDLLYLAWRSRGKPLEEGWHVGADELIRLNSNGRDGYDSQRLLVDLAPYSTTQLNVAELLDVFAFTWGDELRRPAWTPVMMVMRQVCLEICDTPLSPHRRKILLSSIPETSEESVEFVQFLYLHGTQRAWKFGLNSKSQSCRVHGAAREYFRRFF